jgi:hypothetical protein
MPVWCLLCGLLFTLAPCRAFAQLTPGGKTQVGLNLDSNEQSLLNLVDLMNIPDAAGQDANGWPTSDFTLLLDNRYTFAWSPEITNVDPLRYSTNLAGNYTLSYTGQANVAGATNSRYDAATNITHANYRIAKPLDGTNSLLIRISFSGTRRTLESPIGSGVTNIRLEPAAFTDPKQIFTNLWLDSIRSYGWVALRCMDMLKINGYAAPGSSEAYPYRLAWDGNRRLPDAGPLYGKVQPGVHGVPWESIVALGQLTRKDLWINIPVNASDEYVDHLAALFKSGNSSTGGAGVPPDINIYVEYSNEMWHTAFPQGLWNYQAAQDEVKAGGTNLNYDGAAGTPEKWRFRRIAKRTIEIGRQFRKVFDGQPERIRPVINNHTTAPDFDMLQYVAANYGRPADVLYGISQQGYYSSADSSSVQAILEGEKAASDRNRAGYIASRALATYFGLHSLLYEGGQEEKGGDNPAIPDKGLANKFAAARDLGMKDVILHDLIDNWFSSGGELYMVFSQAARYSYWGMWGQTDDLTNLKTGKWLGDVAAMAAPAPPVTAGVALPAVAGQSVDVSENSGPADKVISPRAEPWAIYLLNVPARATYSLAVRANAQKSAVPVRCMIDNSLAGNVIIPAHSKKVSAPAAVTMTLDPGLHSLFLFLDGGQSITVPPGTSLTIVAVGSEGK